MAPIGPHTDSLRRAEAALQLRAKGRTWQAIADELGFRSRQGACQAVGRLVGQMTSDPNYKPMARAASDEGLRMQYEKLRPMFDAAVERDDNEAASMLSRELRAVTTDRAKLTGIAAPSSVSVDVKVSGSPVAILERAEADLLAVLAQRQPRALSSVIDAEVIE